MGEFRIKYIKNESIERIHFGVPRGHKHYRLVVFLKSGEVLVFSEATVANIVRAYVTVKTHPLKRAVELVGVKLEERKEGYAEYQLLETDKSCSEVEEELERIFKG